MQQFMLYTIPIIDSPNTSFYRANILLYTKMFRIANSGGGGGIKVRAQRKIKRTSKVLLSLWWPSWTSLSFQWDVSYHEHVSLHRYTCVRLKERPQNNTTPTAIQNVTFSPLVSNNASGVWWNLLHILHLVCLCMLLVELRLCPFSSYLIELVSYYCKQLNSFNFCCRHRDWWKCVAGFSCTFWSWNTTNGICKVHLPM